MIRQKFIILLVLGITLFFFACENETQVSGMFIKTAIGNAFDEPPKVTNIEAVDLDQDGLLDVVVADALNNTVSWIRQNPIGVYQEIICAGNVLAPSHVQTIDFEDDGDLDIVVSLLGMILPNNAKIGSVILLENDGNMNFSRINIIENVYRVSDARAADIDGDGDKDFVAIQFGYVDGETCWIENLGDGNFINHPLQNLAGGINCEVADIDNDSDEDIITVVSQQWEEVYLFLNDGTGHFTSHLINGIGNEDFGSSGISLSDLDMDGDLDILYTNGDAFDYVPPAPKPWHGINWLENKSNYKFEFKRIGALGGAYNAKSFDYDHDGDMDVIAVSTFNAWDDPTAQSMIWLENDGKMNFLSHNISATPTHILALDIGDFNQDGEIDLVTGGMHVQPPFENMARILLWQNNYSKLK